MSDRFAQEIDIRGHIERIRDPHHAVVLKIASHPTRVFHDVHADTLQVIGWSYSREHE
jgi:hypothetical protein